MSRKGSSSPSRTRTTVAIIACIVAAVVGAVLLAWALLQVDLPPSSVDENGRYRLVATDGSLFDRASLRGRPYVVYFGYTSCPDQCPLMLSRLARARQALGRRGRELRIVFITVDPQRDTPERLRRFVQEIGTPIVALTGSPEVIQKVADSAAIYVRRNDSALIGYTIEHTTNALIYSRDDEFRDTISPADSDAEVLAKLRAELDRPQEAGR